MNFDRTFFVTTITARRHPVFRRDSAARLLIETIVHYRDTGKFLLHEFVIMPDHLHAILTPAPEVSLEKVMQFIKGGFSFRMRSRGPVWQASFTNHRVRNLDDLGSHRQYIWLNPVRARLADGPEDYPYSSATGEFRLDPVPQGLKPGAFEEALTRP